MLTHGGDIVGFAEQYGEKPLDFSVNTNPFGFSPNAKNALLHIAERACEYPDPLYRRLRAAIADHEHIPMEWIACGNGAADLIWRIVFASRPRQALVTAPTFSEYETALSAVDCRVEHYILSSDNGFRLNSDILCRITPKLDILFLCNPNNPTGLTIDQTLLQQIVDRCRICDVLLVVDECFLGFLPHSEQMTLKPYLSANSRLVILKAFTKLYGMAGLRLGYCLCSDSAFLADLCKVGQCWPVSVAAEEAGIAALKDAAFVEKTLAYLPAERERIRKTMEQFGMLVYPGEANYLFFYTDISHYQERLAEHGILIRSCSNYIGLQDGYYRAAVLTPDKNDRLLSAMKHLRSVSPSVLELQMNGFSLLFIQLLR